MQMSWRLAAIFLSSRLQKSLLMLSSSDTNSVILIMQLFSLYLLPFLLFSLYFTFFLAPESGGYMQELNSTGRAESESKRSVLRRHGREQRQEVCLSSLLLQNHSGAFTVALLLVLQALRKSWVDPVGSKASPTKREERCVRFWRHSRKSNF